MSAQDDLVETIFGREHPALRDEFASWARESRRFAAFADTYRAKIRAKLRNARDDDGLLDVRAELATAALLLREPRFGLEYEKYAALKQRGPDFTGTFKTHTPFNVEVRRVRSLELPDSEPGDGDEARATRLSAVLIDKVGQMPPGIVNLLWLWTGRELDANDLTRATAALRRLAERRADDFFARRGFDDAAAFQQRYRRLSGVVLHRPGDQSLWLNPLARHVAPSDLAAAVRRLSAF